MCVSRILEHMKIVIVVIYGLGVIGHRSYFLCFFSFSAVNFALN